MKALRKDNTGYDLRHLLIGSEGTLGVITAAALKLFPLPGETVTAMLTVPSPDGAVALLHTLRERLGDGVTAFELIADQGIAFLAEFFPDRTQTLWHGRPDWRVLVEMNWAGRAADLTDRAEAAMGGLFEDGLATDGALAANEAQRRHMWWMRETLPECNRRVGSVSSHDISLPLSRIGTFIDQAQGDVVAGFGPDLEGQLFRPCGRWQSALQRLPAARWKGGGLSPPGRGCQAGGA